MKIEFTKDKETKNTVRFSGAAEDGTVNGSLYISKGSDLEKESVISLEVEKAELQEAYQTTRSPADKSGWGSYTVSCTP